MRFADFDALGHVNNVNLQHYFDLGKSDFYRRVVGLGAYGPVGAEVYPVTAATETNYLAQTRPGEDVYVETALEKVGNKSMVLMQRLVARGTGEVKATSRSVMVAFDFARQESVPVPETWRASN
jgi:acyl-CoA thioesterase FadM